MKIEANKHSLVSCEGIVKWNHTLFAYNQECLEFQSSFNQVSVEMKTSGKLIQFLKTHKKDPMLVSYVYSDLKY